MEFLGFSSDNFEFFRKKDKMSKAEYEKNRNEVKLSFRCLCYDVQKMYHKKTNGVLEINKEFSNFNKRSQNISADYGENSELAKNIIEMNIENVAIKLLFSSNDEESAKLVLDKIKNKKKQIVNFLVSEKHNQINYSFKGKGNKQDMIKLNSMDVNDKSYDAIVENVVNGINNGKYTFEVTIQHTCPKAEAIKQEKNLIEFMFKDIIGIMDLHTELC
jgi:hypothetical protein